METQDDSNKRYPDGFKHIEQRVNETMRQVRQIDKQLENLPPNSKPVPQLTPPGMGTTGKFFNRDEVFTYLKDKRDSILRDAWTDVEKNTQAKDEKNAGVARDTARQALFPNPYRKLGIAEKDQQRHTPKEIEQSQDYMDALRLDKTNEQTLSQLAARSDVDSNKADALSPAERYARSLSFNRYQKEGIKITKAGPEPDKA